MSGILAVGGFDPATIRVAVAAVLGVALAALLVRAGSRFKQHLRRR